MTTSPKTSDVGCPRRSMSPIPIETTQSIWNRRADRVDDAPPETRTIHESTRPSPFPDDITEMIATYLIYNLGALKACSLTCRSLYTAAAPHLHYALTLTGDAREISRRQLQPLSELHKLGLIHLVKSIRVKQGINTPWFVPGTFGDLDLCHFSALANVHTLKLQGTDICDFIPGAERYFGHFSQTLRSISLYSPRCTPRQLSYFLSLFLNLDSIGIWNTRTPKLITTTIPEIELAPLFALKLRGRLALRTFGWTETWEHLITSNSDLRFCHMDLYKSASCAPILFEACAETLDTLRFGTVGSAEDLNLSPLKVLRSLQVPPWLGDPSQEVHPPTILMKLLSTITSPAFSELVITVSYFETCLPWAVPLFRELRAINEVRRFKLVFFLETSGCLGAQEELVKALDTVTAQGLLDFLDSPPTIRIARICDDRWNFLDFD